LQNAKTVREWNAKVAQIGLLSALLALLFLALIPILRFGYELISLQVSHLHRPSYLWPLTALVVASAVALFWLSFGPRVLRSLQLGLLPVATLIWVFAGTAFLILFDLAHPVTAFSVVILAELLTLIAFAVKTPRTKEAEQIQFLDPDLPVQEDGTDLLGRDDVVDYLASIVIREKPSVIAVTGNYGDGKTSVLNLVLGRLRKLDGEQRPIIVKFSPWLPGNSATLVSSLLSSITAEIRRECFMPGLNQGARRYGRVLLGVVPKAEALKELFSDLSQQERIKSLTDQIAKMPRRILVTLDNLDRMEARELEIVFKILRGADDLSSVTFLCCFDSQELSSILKKTRRHQDTRRFIEKCFQIMVALPPIDRAKLKQVFVDEMLRIEQGTQGQKNDG
jgi:hypothetical protein